MSTIKPLVYDAANARLAEQAVIIPPGYIDGLNLVWNSGTSISVTSGSAYIESLGAVVNVPATLTLSGLSLAASTWYHVYLYLNSGAPEIECVTTDPATAYSGDAHSKIGDSSRRYIGSVRTNSISEITNFHNIGNRIIFLIDTGSIRPLSGGTSATWTDVSVNSLVPITGIVINTYLFNTGTGTFRLRSAGGSWITDISVSVGIGAGASSYFDIYVGSNQLFSYRVDTGGIGYVTPIGYIYTR